MESPARCRRRPGGPSSTKTSTRYPAWRSNRNPKQSPSGARLRPEKARPRGTSTRSRPPEPPMDSGLREASLAEELAAIRSRRDRLRLERERTEKALRERDSLMQSWAVELEKWADEQRNLELEFRLLIQLQDLRCSSMMWSPVQSLREQEQQRSMEEQLQGPDGAKQDTEVDESSSSRQNESE